MALPVPRPVHDKYYNGYFADIGVAGSIYIPIAARGKITAIHITPLVTCATTATVVTCSIGGVAITNGVVTLATTQAAGTVASATPSGANRVESGATVQLATDGGTSTTSPAIVTVVVRESTI